MGWDGMTGGGRRASGGGEESAEGGRGRASLGKRRTDDGWPRNGEQDEQARCRQDLPSLRCAVSASEYVPATNLVRHAGHLVPCLGAPHYCTVSVLLHESSYTN